MILALFLAYFALIFNIYNLQLEKGNYFSARAETQDRLSGFLEPRRGDIYFIDKDGVLIPVAMNKSYPVIFAVPKEISDPQETAQVISSVLGLDNKKIAQSFGKANDEYELLVSKAVSEQVSAIKNLALEGIYVDEKESRFYPFKELAAHLLGFVGPSDDNNTFEGKYGLEAYFNDSLGGVLEFNKDNQPTGAIKGKDLVLTIDRNIQARAEEILKKLVEQYSAVGGTVLVNEPASGRILAMGNYPTFDPNGYWNYQVGNFLNPAIQGIYEPGSIFKVITMAAGIDSGKITPQTAFNDLGSVSYNGYTIKNWDLKAHGRVTMTEAIEQSINTAAVFAERQTGHDIFYNYLLKFGFGEKTDIKLPGELRGSLKTLEQNGKDINFATASFGQGVSLTPLQLLSAVGAIANDGKLMKPIILKDEKPRVVRRVISESAAKQVAEMMVSAVDKARIAKIENYEVAGKTGTAQVPDFQSGGYTDKVTNSYAGFAPASNPRFTILFKLDKPEGSPLAGLTVVPAFRELAQFILNYYNVPPDRLAPQIKP